MSETSVETPRLPFEHPDVQAILRDNTERVRTSHLWFGMVGQKCSNIGACTAAEAQDGRPRTALINAMWTALTIEAPVAVVRSLAEYESLEESISLVKVDEDGSIIPGSEAHVGILDHRSRAVLLREPSFTRADIDLVVAMAQAQDALPWEPKRPDPAYSPAAQDGFVTNSPPFTPQSP